MIQKIQLYLRYFHRWNFEARKSKFSKYSIQFIRTFASTISGKTGIGNVAFGFAGSA
jgi:hypothetical protein